MNKLPQNFELDRYGLHVRLVQEADAEFIVKLRTDETLRRYLGQTKNDIAAQRDWIAKYKQRETEGTDYYFIYYHNEKPIGVNRIYNIEEDKATTGSWVCVADINPVLSISTMLIVREVFFEELQIATNCFTVDKRNARVLKLHQMMGATISREDEINYYFTQTNDSFEDSRNRIVKLFGLKR